MKIRTAIVDDNHFLSKSVIEKLSFFEGMEICFTATDGVNCLEKLEMTPDVDLILMDIEMPRMNGIEATARVKEKYPKIKIIVLTVFDDDENIFNAIQSGADGYLLKDTNPRALQEAIRETLDGGAVMTPSIAAKALNFLRSPGAVPAVGKEQATPLSEREIEVLEKLSTGQPYTSIAETLFISPSTVRRHLENIYKKLQVHSKLEAIDLARKRRII